MTQHELELLRLSLRVEVLKATVAPLYGAVAALSPGLANTLTKTFAEIRAKNNRLALPGLSAEFSDLIASEYQEAVNDIIGPIEGVMRS